MSVSGRVLTRHFEHESRQHDLLGLDLGEGPRRRVIIIGAASLAIWGGLCFLLLGIPNKYSFTLYFLPPIALTMIGTQRDGRRMRLTNWLLSLRYALIDHRPIIRAGARRPHRAEYVPWRHRWHVLTGLGRRLVPAAARPAWAEPDQDDHHQQRPTARPIHLHQKARVVGGDTMLAFLQRRRRHGRKVAAR